MRLTIVIVISLNGLICSWVNGRVAAAAVARPSILDTSGSDSGSIAAFSVQQQPTQNDDKAQLLKNTETWRWRDGRASATVTGDQKAQFNNTSTDDGVLPASLIRKIVSILGRRRPPSAAVAAAAAATPSITTASATSDPNKQLFGGRLPPFIERIIQRIQNYFSVYNPPEYFEGNRPPATSTSTDGQQHAAITLICTNSSTGSVSCNEMGASEEQEEEESEQGETLEVCDGGVPSNSEEENSVGTDGTVAATQQQQQPDEYNVVVTHTIVQDSSLNVYSPVPVPIDSDSTQMVSNVVVILEPAAGQYSPPPLDNPDKNKFYVYVNPTSANKNQQQRLKTWNENADRDGDGDDVDVDADADANANVNANTRENFQPYLNTTYTVIIRGDQLQQYDSDLQNAANASSSDPQIAIYIRNSSNSTKKLKKCKLPSQPAETEAADCEPNANASNAPFASRSTTFDSDNGNGYYDHRGNDSETKTVETAETKSDENSNKVPNINLMLVPPNDQQQKSKNKSCASKNKVTKNPQLQYYVLKPDNGNKAKTDDAAAQKPTFYLQKTNIDAGTLSQTYLPPLSSLPPIQQTQRQDTRSIP